MDIFSVAKIGIRFAHFMPIFSTPKMPMMLALASFQELEKLVSEETVDLNLFFNNENDYRTLKGIFDLVNDQKYPEADSKLEALSIEAIFSKNEASLDDYSFGNSFIGASFVTSAYVEIPSKIIKLCNYFHPKVAIFSACSDGGQRTYTKCLIDGIKADREEALEIVRDKSKNAALSIALKSGMTSEAIELMESGADPNVLLGGCPAVFSLIDAWSYKPVEKMLECGLNPNSKKTFLNESRYSYLIIELASNKKEKLIERCIELGADVNATNYWDSTALHQAVYNKSMKLVKILVASGATIDQRDKNGDNPLDIALRLEKKSIAKYLEKAFKG